LIEARAEIERLNKCNNIRCDYIGEIREAIGCHHSANDGEAIEFAGNLRVRATAAESQIAALKVDLAAMMKERDIARVEATMYKQASDDRFASLMSACDERDAAEKSRDFERERANEGLVQKHDAEKARDAALAELGQVRAELAQHEHCDVNADTVGMIREVTNAAGHGGVPFLIDAVRNVVIERDAAVKRAEALREENASLRKVQNVMEKDMNSALLVSAQSAQLLKEIVNHFEWAEDHKSAELLRRADAILADATATPAADAWRAQRESLKECVDRLEMVQSLAADGYRLRPAEKEAIAKAIKEARRLLDGGSQ